MVKGVAVPAVIEDRVSKAQARKLDRALEPFEEASLYLTDHLEELLQHHEDEWIAIDRQQVVAHSKTWLGLKRQLARLSRPLAQLYVIFLTRKRRTLIL